MSEGIYVYAINPIDFWQGWHKPEDIFRVMADYELSSRYPEGEVVNFEFSEKFLDAKHWYEQWELAQHFARQIGWEGDIRQGPYVAPMPLKDGDTAFVIAWKHDNNGDTFVASTHELPHLRDNGNWVRGTAAAMKYQRAQRPVPAVKAVKS